MSIFEDFEIEIPLKHRVKFREIISAYDAIVDDNADLKAKYKKVVQCLRNVVEADSQFNPMLNTKEYWACSRMAQETLAELGEE